MSALRRLTSSFRSERRSEQACPYSRPQSSPPKPKPTRRPRYWDFFNFFSFFTPYGDEEEEEAKKQAEAKATASGQVEVVVVPEQDSEMSDASVSASSTEESMTTTSDSSLDTVETAVTAELVEPTKPSEPARSAHAAEPVELARPTPSPELVEAVMTVEAPTPSQSSKSTSTVSPQQPTPSVSQPTKISNQPVISGTQSYSSAPMPAFIGSTDDEVIEWAMRKRDSQTPMDYTEYLGLKEFFERTRKELQHEPIKLRFMPRHTSPAPSSANAPAFDTALPQTSTLPDSNRLSASTDSHSAPADPPTYWSAFHSSTGLPTFKNNVPASRPRRMLKAPIVMPSASSTESRKRPAPLVVPRIDPYKRRRLFSEARGPVSTPDTVPPQGSTNAPGSVPLVTSRLPRTGPNRQHAVPHSPSPLRNVVNGSPPASPPRQGRTIPTNLSASSSRSTPTNQTASAAYLQEAVEKVMPRRPRYSDVANPYEAAAPVKPVIKPVDRKRMLERRARTKEIEKQKEAAKTKEPEKRELSAKEIIEATVPKGAKRSRPPPDLAKCRPGSSATPRVAGKRVLEQPEEESTPTKKRRTVTVEEIPEEDDVRRRSFPARPNVIIESRSPSPEPTRAPVRPATEILRAKETSSKPSPAKVPVQGTQPAVKEAPIKASPTKETSARIKETAGKNLHTPKAPSSKEVSTKVSTKGSSAKGPSNHFSPLLNSKVTGKSSVPREPSKLRTSFLPDDCENEEPKMASPTPSATVTMTAPGTPLADIQEKKDPKEVALTLPLNDLPSFIFKTPPALMAGDHTDARVAAKELPVTSLPKFDFSKARTAMNGVVFPAVPIPTIKPFDFESAGVMPEVLSGNGQWQCPTCMLQNPASAVEKCSICEAPRPGTEKLKKVVLNGINGVNGAKTPASVNGKGPSPKSSATSTTSPAVKTFDFAAAGLTPKAPVSDGHWTCSTCMLQNPATASEKCIVCDSPRSGAGKTEKSAKPKKSYLNGTSHSSKTLTNVTTPSTVKSFDFTAAGLTPKAPAANGNWHCPTCMLQNPVTALEKCKVCDSPRPGTDKRTTQPSVVPVKSIPQLVPRSFDWAGAGLVSKLNGSSWTCGTCMLNNPPTETEKCKVCDASRS